MLTPGRSGLAPDTFTMASGGQPHRGPTSRAYRDHLVRLPDGWDLGRAPGDVGRCRRISRRPHTRNWRLGCEPEVGMDIGTPLSGRRGLVLGAGGSLGTAWMIGTLAALKEVEGLDPSTCDVLV